MKGSRPLTKAEVVKVRQSFSGRNADRDRTLFSLGINTGFRISELVSLTVGDVVTRAGTIAQQVTVARRNMKGSKASRTVRLNSKARAALAEYIDEHKNLPDEPGAIKYAEYLFASERDKYKPIDRTQAWKILHHAFDVAGLEGTLGTHSMRKTFANNFYQNLLDRAAAGENVDPLRATSKALGHANLDNTDKYLSFRQEVIDETIENIAI